MFPQDFMRTPKIIRLAFSYQYIHELTFWTTVVIFPHNFFFSSDLVEEQSIIKIISFSRKNVDSVVLCDSEFTFLEEGEGAAFCSFLFYVMSIDALYNRKSISSNFFDFRWCGVFCLQRRILGRFWKRSFRFCIFASWLSAFSFGL